MTLEQITELANSYADEQFDEEIVEHFVNEAIAKINITLDVHLPFFDDTGADYNAIDNSWQRMLFVPYVTYSIKLNDGSLNEAQTNLYQRFETSMRELKRSRSFDIPKRYRLRWIQIDEADYNLAAHKKEVATAAGTYEVDTEDLPGLGETGYGITVDYPDLAIKLTITGNGEIEYYQLRDSRQVAELRFGRRTSNNSGWWF